MGLQVYRSKNIVLRAVFRLLYHIEHEMIKWQNEFLSGARLLPLAGPRPWQGQRTPHQAKSYLSQWDALLPE
jgi:hypothetical protein